MKIFTISISVIFILIFSFTMLPEIADAIPPSEPKKVCKGNVKLVTPDSGPAGTVLEIKGLTHNEGETGVVWFDSNKNSLFDEGEPSQTVTTDSFCSYNTQLTIPNVEPGRYKVRMDVPGLDGKQVVWKWIHVEPLTPGGIINGDFETGDLTGWIPNGINDGLAYPTLEGTCFSSADTTGITFNGNYAANVRSGGSAQVDSVGVLTSSPFIAGSSIEFKALSEYHISPPVGDTNPVTLEVRLLDSGLNVLQSQEIQTNIVGLFNSCPSTPIDGTFSIHTIDSTAFSGQTIQIEFRQHTNTPSYGFFTLIDDVVVP